MPRTEDVVDSKVSRRSLIVSSLIATAAATTYSVGGNTFAAQADAIPTATGAWGNYNNGEIPTSALSRVGNIWLRADAAAALRDMMTAFRGARGHDLILNDGYRDLAGQRKAYNDYLYNGGNLAAYPGTSNHGWALSVDFGGQVYLGPNTTDFQWMRNNAGRFGWWWEGGGFRQIEYHHWTFAGSYAPNPQEPEDDMYDANAQAALFRKIENDTRPIRLYTWGSGIIAVGPGGKEWIVPSQAYIDLLVFLRLCGPDATTINNDQHAFLLQISGQLNPDPSTSAQAGAVFDLSPDEAASLARGLA